MAARLYGRVSVAGIVGEDYPRRVLDDLSAAGVDVRTVQRRPGDTFRWHVRYDEEGSRTTLDTNRGRTAAGAPHVPDRLRDPDALFLGSTDPRVQRALLDASGSPGLVVLDTMSHWVTDRRAEFDMLLPAADILLANEEEARLLGGLDTRSAAERLRRAGVRWLVVKHGAGGVTAFGPEGSFTVPAAPAAVVDPTGAGDALAGGLTGALVRWGPPSSETMPIALAHGAVLGALVVGAFSWRGLTGCSIAEVDGAARALLENAS
jgi:sugar/nucleoside kinase (ribokinase family)